MRMKKREEKEQKLRPAIPRLGLNAASLPRGTWKNQFLSPRPQNVLIFLNVYKACLNKLDDTTPIINTVVIKTLECLHCPLHNQVRVPHNSQSRAHGNREWLMRWVLRASGSSWCSTPEAGSIGNRLPLINSGCHITLALTERME